MTAFRIGRIVRARGLTVVELMISLALGLLVMLAGSALLVSSNAAYVNQAEAARLNDSARYALDTIGRAIRQTAFVNWDGADAAVTVRPEDSASISGFDARSVSRDSDGIGAPLAGVANGSDVLAVRYFGAGTGADGDGSVINCAGFGVGRAASEAERGWSIFYVATDRSGETELRCKYRGERSWGADAIVRGVDTFQVLYGLDTDEPADGTANRYVNATELRRLDEALLLVGVDAAARERDRQKKTRWKRVVSIKIALLLHGERNSLPVSLPVRFDMFGKEYADAYAHMDAGVRIDEATMVPKLRAHTRHAVITTILLRNPPA